MTIQQTTVELIFHEMGYSSSTEYAVKKVREELLHELKRSVEAIAVFEKKYGMNYEEFYERFNELTQFGLFEREDDSMDWRAELAVLRGVEKRLSRLTL